VDGLDQAESRGPFAWGSLVSTNVERWILGCGFEVFRGNHTGCARLPSPVIHERWVVHFKGMGWLIRDVALGSGRHSLDLAWHLGPKLSSSGKNFFLSEQGNGLCFLTCEPSRWSAELRDEWWSPAYGIRVPTKTLHHSFTGLLPAELAVFLQTADSASTIESASLQSDSSTENRVRAYGYAHDQKRCGALFAASGQPWSHVGWSSDADLLCYHATGDRLDSLLLCNASFVEWRGLRLWSSTRPAHWCELARREESMEIVSIALTPFSTAHGSRAASVNK
jgi:hypothetical protein